jgi:uncharacterized membrane protein
MTSNIYYTLIWWVWLLMIGLASIPLSFVLFKRFFDKGYGFSKILSILFSSYFVFFLSTLKILPFSRIALIAVLVVLLIVNGVIFFKNKTAIKTTLANKWGLMLFEEGFFAFGLILWSFVRAHQPDISGLEKLMDFGFVNTILKAEFLPPQDMWAAGLPINYYWYGHYVSAFLVKLTNIPSGFGYNLMLGTILGLSLVAGFSLTSSLLWNNFGKKFRTAVMVGGVISAILLNFAGNFHTPFYVLKNGVDKYWYPDATRFIGYNPDVPDKTIHEFPIYSYVVSDLHAHLLNVPFVLLFLALLYSNITAKRKGTSSNLKFEIRNLKSIEYLKLIIENFPSKLIILGMLLGVMFMTNAWDFANYLLVTGFVLLISSNTNLRKTINIDNFLKIAGNIIFIMITAGLTVIPFIIHFESIAQGVALTHTKTPLWQLTILWGFPALLSILFLLGSLFIKKPKKEDMFVFALLISSWMLIALPEFVYVKDIYAATHYRANTMFKLTYQAFVMSYLASGYIAISLIKNIKYLVIKILLILIFAIAFTAILYYPFLAVKSYYGKLTDKDNPAKSLSGDTWLEEKYPDTFAVISWFRKNVPDQPVILEAPGDSYTDYDVISSYTGLPTVSGWYVHEWLWRGTPDFPQARVNDITEIYNTKDPQMALSLLTKYSVRYVIVGSFEREKFPEIDEGKFLKIGKVVFSTPTAKIFRIN